MQRKLNLRGLFPQITYILILSNFVCRSGFVALVILACVAVGPIRCQVSPCINNPSTSLVNFPVPEDCNYFIRCIGTLELRTPCPTGFHFSMAIRDCAPIAEAQCTPTPPDTPGNPGDPGNPGPGPNPPGTPSQICDINVNFQIVASMDDCSKYTICACGQEHPQNCAAGLTFDAAAGQCQPTGVCVSSPSFQPVCNNFVGFRPHPTDCMHYFLCAGAAPILRRCAAGLLFSQVTNRCEVNLTVTCVGSNPLLTSVKPRASFSSMFA